jgi:hypothetical protein
MAERAPTVESREPAIVGTVLTVTLLCPRCGRRLHNEAGGVAFWPPRGYPYHVPPLAIRCAWCAIDLALPAWPGPAAIEDDPR